MSALGPFEDLCIAGMGQAFPPQSYSTFDALTATPAGTAMGPDRARYIADELDATLGLETRYWVSPPGTEATMNTADLAAEAVRAALADAGLRATDLAGLLVATSTPHRYTGSVAAAVGAALGVEAACVDLRAGCSAGFFALQQAALMVTHGSGPVAIVGADVFSRVIPPTHRLATFLLGDGAAALIVARGSGCLQRVYFESDGRHGGLVKTAGPMPPTVDAVAAGAYQLSGDSAGLDARVRTDYQRAIDAVAADGTVDRFVPHQTTRPMVEAVREAAGLTDTPTSMNGIAAHANIGAGGWMAALAQATPKPGERVLCAGVGGGMSWGSALWIW